MGRSYVGCARAPASWRTGRRVIWTVPAVGYARIRKRENEKRNAGGTRRSENSRIHESGDL